MKVSAIVFQFGTHKPDLHYFTGGSFICPGHKTVKAVNRVVSDTKKMLEGYSIGVKGVKTTEIHPGGHGVKRKRHT